MSTEDGQGSGCLLVCNVSACLVSILKAPDPTSSMHTNLWKPLVKERTEVEVLLKDTRSWARLM